MSPDISNSISEIFFSEGLNHGYACSSYLPVEITASIIGALVGAFSAYIFNHIHWKQAEKKRIQSEALNIIYGLITDLESLAVYYWTHDRSDESAESEVILKARLRLLAKLAKDPYQKKSHFNGNGDLYKSLENYSYEIYDLVTGDGFEAANMTASKSKALKIALMCSEIKSLLNNHK